MLSRAQLPLISATDSFWKSLCTSTVSSSPMWRALAEPSFFTSVMAHLCHPPRDSTATGRKEMPWRLQASQDLSSFLL